MEQLKKLAIKNDVVIRIQNTQTKWTIRIMDFIKFNDTAYFDYDDLEKNINEAIKLLKKQDDYKNKSV